MNSGFECNLENTFNAFMELTTKEMQNTVKKALKKGAVKLKEQTKSNFSTGIKSHGNPHWYDGNRITYNDEVEDAVRVGRYTNSYGEEQSISVHIMGTRDSSSGTFRARFLEKGTKERYARKGRNRNHELITLKKPKRLGRINGGWYFKNAQTQVIPELPSLFMQEIDKCINKLNNTKI